MNPRTVTININTMAYKITQSIQNATNSTAKLEPIAYFCDPSQLTIVGDTVTAIAGILGEVVGFKDVMNANFERVERAYAPDLFKHTVSFLFNDNFLDVDRMSNVAFFVRRRGTNTFQCYGAKYGLEATAQDITMNENHGFGTKSLSSPEGTEEPFSFYAVTANVNAVPKAGLFETIYNLTIPSGTTTPQKIYLKVDTGKTAYVALPDGTFLQSTAGVIDTNWSGIAGDVRLIVPKTNALLYTTDGVSGVRSGFRGIMRTKYSTFVYLWKGLYEEVDATMATTVMCPSLDNLKKLNCPKAVVLDASSCPALPESNLYKLIDDMYQLYLDGIILTGGVLNLGGTTRAINDFLISERNGQPYAHIRDDLDAAGVTITYNSL